MSQHDMDIADATFAAFRTDLNLALKALASNSSGGTAPATLFAGQFYVVNTSVTVNSLYYYDGADSILIATFNHTANTVEWGTAATTALKGAVLLASLAEALAGTDTAKAITAEGLKGATSRIQQNSKSANYTTVLTDAGKSIFHPASDANARTFTIDSNANVAYPIDTVLTFINRSANAVTIAITSDTLTWTVGGAAGSRTLAQYGIATAVKIGTTEWLITGTNLS